jgi:hypothetical protein
MRERDARDGCAGDGSAGRPDGAAAADVTPAADVAAAPDVTAYSDCTSAAGVTYHAYHADGTGNAGDADRSDRTAYCRDPSDSHDVTKERLRITRAARDFYPTNVRPEP